MIFSKLKELMHELKKTLGSKDLSDKELIDVRALYYKDAKQGKTEDQLN